MMPIKNSLRFIQDIVTDINPAYSFLLGVTNHIHNHGFIKSHEQPVASHYAKMGIYRLENPANSLGSIE